MEHFWKHHRHNPFEPEKKNHMQVMICDRCLVIMESPYGANPDDYHEVACAGEKPRPKLIQKARERDRTPIAKDYPAKKKIKQKGVRT